MSTRFQNMESPQNPLTKWGLFFVASQPFRGASFVLGSLITTEGGGKRATKKGQAVHWHASMGIYMHAAPHPGAPSPPPPLCFLSHGGALPLHIPDYWACTLKGKKRKQLSSFFTGPGLLFSLSFISICPAAKTSPSPFHVLSTDQHTCNAS